MSVKKINLEELDLVAGGVLGDEDREKLRMWKAEYDKVEAAYIAGKATEEELNKAFEDFYAKYRTLSV